jgi:hypothetical protein
MNDPDAGDLPAARWAHQHNIGETSQDRQDKRDGVRCLLRGGPCDGLAVAESPREDLASDGRGYAPNHIRRPSDVPDLEYVYKWASRSAGIHYYAFEGRQGHLGGIWRDEVPLLFRGGPLNGQQEWMSRPKSSGSQKINQRESEGVLYDEAFLSSRGELICRGKVRCRLASYYGEEKGEERWVDAANIRSPVRGYWPGGFSVATQPDGNDHYRWDRDNIYRFSGSTWSD